MPKASGTRQTTAPASAPSRRTGRTPGAPVKYQQVADAIRAAIVSGALPPASALPSETQLMTEHDISRPTARAAIAALRAEGLITVLHGKGAFVRPASDRPAHTHDRAVTTRPGPRGSTAYTDTGSAGWTVVGEPGRYATTATPDIALALGVAEHTPLVVFERLLASPAGRRLSWRLYLPLAVLAAARLDPDSTPTPADLYAALGRRGGPLHWTDHVRARMPAPDDATALHIPDGTPMLVTRRTTHNADGGVLAVEDSKINADDAQLAYRLDPTPDPAEPETARPRRRQ
jgi:GntR family transcriptional regulator